MNITKKRVGFRPQVRSRHPSHSPLRFQLARLPFRSIIRLGSTTEVNDGKTRVEINSIESIKNSMNKFRMKQYFYEAGVKTADWYLADELGGVLYFHSPECTDIINNSKSTDTLEYPLVAKHLYGSRGRGNYLLKSKEELENWLGGKHLNNYIFEKFYNYNREYRLHITKDGCFYTCRKMLKTDTPEDKRWFRNDSNSVWIVEENEVFDRPTNWNTIVAESVKALKAVGLDVGAVDLRIQSSRNSKGELRENPDFIIVEINSAPSFGDITLEKYLEILPKLLRDKYDSNLR